MPNCNCCCGANTLSMSTVNVNPSSCQSVCCDGGCGGASSLSSALNAVGHWGTVLMATAQGKPVQSGNVRVGAKGAQSLPGTGRLGSNALILILIIVVILIYMATR